MKTKLFLLSVAVMGLATSCQQKPESQPLADEVQYVDPFIGTGFHGHTFPGATRPYAMVQLSPDTHIMGWDASSGYHYDDQQIYGFSHTHLSGTGIGDLGDILLLPFSGGDSIKPVATFKKETEKATPGYYAVRLENLGVNVELTSTDRVGFHRYTFDNPKDRRVMLDLGHVLQPNWGHKLVSNDYQLVNDSTVEGTYKTQGWAHFHSVSYRVTFSEPMTKIYQYIDGKMRSDSLFLKLHSDKDLKFHYRFKESDKPLLVKVALSPVDVEGAEKNMEAELPGWDFDQVRAESADIWNKALNKIQIETNDPVIRNGWSLFGYGQESAYSRSRLYELYGVLSVGYVPCLASVDDDYQSFVGFGYGKCVGAGLYGRNHLAEMAVGFQLYRMYGRLSGSIRIG